MIRHLIWDVDGTLFDTYPAIARSFQVAARDLGVTVSFDEVMRLAQVSLDHCLATLSTIYALATDQLEAHFDLHYQTITPEDQLPFAGVEAVCEHIRSRGGLNLIVTHRQRAGLDRLLATHRLTDYFIDITSNDDAYPRKPDPAAFNALIERHQLSRDATLGVGDRDIDILAAQAAGLRAALFGSNYGAATPDLVFSDYTVFLRKLNNNELSQ
ncbi:MAG TPA: HAD-IA family hydrolase [Anaerolineae bacterium]|nr:HAD-IA family hydrolase [Anaerolineae bacterium]